MGLNARGSKKNELQYSDNETNYTIIDRCLIIQIHRELDHHNAFKIKEKSDQLIERHNVRNIIFDFTDTNFMDSSGIGMIMGRYKRVIFIGGKVAVTNIDHCVDRIFRLSGLYKIITKFDDTKTALNELRVVE